MIQDKLRHKRLQWFGYVRRETERGVLRLVKKMKVLGIRKVGRPRKTWKDIADRDLELMRLDESVALDKGKLGKLNASPTPN